MKRLDDDTIAITNEEAIELYEILRNFMHSDWDHYTDHVISSTPKEQLMQELNPQAYDLANQLCVV